MKIKNIEYIHHSTSVPVYDVINAGELHNFIVVAGDTNIVAHNCVMDETNFAKSGVKDINKAKQHMKNLIAERKGAKPDAPKQGELF